MPPKSKNILLIIDPQVDFHPGGSLAVQGANEDSARIASLISENIQDIDEIYVTLDSHHVSLLIRILWYQHSCLYSLLCSALISHMASVG